MRLPSELPLRVEAKDGESASSLFMRLSGRYPNSSLNHFVGGRTAAKALFHSARAGTNVDSVAAFSGVDAVALAHWTVRLADNELRLAGQLIGRSVQSKYAIRHRACPLCILEDRASRGFISQGEAFRRSWWDLRVIDHCHIHNVELQAYCCKCAAALYPQPGDAGLCKCGFDIARSNPIPVDPTVLRGEAYLLGRLGVADRIAHEVLDQLQFVDAAALMRDLGRAALSKSGTYQDCAPSLRVRTKLAAMEALEFWPSNFLRLLDHLSSYGTMLSDQSHRGYKVFKMRVTRHGGKWGPVPAAFFDHADRYVRPIRAELAKHPDISFALALAARTLQIGALQDNWIPSAQLDPAVINRKVALLINSMSSSSVYDRLNLTANMLTDLVRRKYLLPLVEFPHGTNICVSRKYGSNSRFNKKEVEIIARIFEKPNVTLGRNREIKSIDECVNVLKIRRSHIVRSVIDGSINVYGTAVGETGIKAALIDFNDAVALRKRLLAARSASRAERGAELKLKQTTNCEGFFTAWEASMLTDFHEGIWLEARSKGFIAIHLDSALGKCNRKTKLFSMDEINAFCKKYTALNELIDASSGIFGKKYIVAAMERHNVYPIMKSRKKYIYVREQAENVIKYEIKKAYELGAPFNERKITGKQLTLKPEGMSDTQWHWVSYWMEEAKIKRGRRTENARAKLDGIFFLARSGLAVRLLPVQFGTGDQIKSCRDRWRKAGLWSYLLSKLNSNNGNNKPFLSAAERSWLSKNLQLLHDRHQLCHEVQICQS